MRGGGAHTEPYSFTTHTLKLTHNEPRTCTARAHSAPSISAAAARALRPSWSAVRVLGHCASSCLACPMSSLLNHATQWRQRSVLRTRSIRRTARHERWAGPMQKVRRQSNGELRSPAYAAKVACTLIALRPLTLVNFAASPQVPNALRRGGARWRARAPHAWVATWRKKCGLREYRRCTRFCEIPKFRIAYPAPSVIGKPVKIQD